MTDSLDDADDAVLVSRSLNVRHSSASAASASSSPSPSPSSSSSSSPVTVTVDGWADSWDTSASLDDLPDPEPSSVSIDGWHTVGHCDLLASVDGSGAVPVSSGPAQREDVTAVFWAKLQRLSVGPGDIHSVTRKLQVIRLWLETNDCDDSQPHDEAASSWDESSQGDPGGPASDLAAGPADWCYVDLPQPATSYAGTFWLVHRDALQAPLPQAVKLDFSDLAVIEALLEVVTTKWKAVLAQCISRQVPCADVVLAMQDVLFTVDCFTQHIRPIFFRGYRTGDVIFYDLEARRRLGVERPNLALHLQKWYDTFSHSAIFLWEDGLPKVLHNLSSRLKVCSWRDCVYMAKREIDFDRVFTGFRFLAPADQQQVRERYREAVVEKARQSKDYVVESLSFFRGLQCIVTARQYVPNPPLIRRASPSILDTDPVTSPSPTPEVATAAAASTGNSIPHFSEMMCAGFTAGFVFECLREVQGSFPAWQEELAFTSALFIDLDRMTPKDLHQWDVWRDTGQRCPLSDILHPEVLANRDKQPNMQ